jgi:hypothetical protein
MAESTRVAQPLQRLTTNWTIGIRSPTEEEHFFLPLCRYCFWSPLSLLYNGHGMIFFFPGVKDAQGLTLPAHPT